jgi:hypothetical protein
MKQRRRIYHSASQRALIWDRWRQGYAIHQIAGLLDRFRSSIQGILGETGGIRPVNRRRSKSALTLAEREEIFETPAHDFMNLLHRPVESAGKDRRLYRRPCAHRL